jgi:hypothetical protein
VAERRAAPCLLLFAKSPRPGHAKTRLAPPLDRAQCAAAARALLQCAARSLGALPADWRVRLCADDPACLELRALAAAHGFRIAPQGEGGLGERMARAARAGLARHAGAIIVGSDCTGLDAQYLRAAAAALDRGCDAVLGPALDGGYVLIGLRRVPAGLFDGIAWGGPEVAAAQRRRFRELGLRWTELPPRADVDRAGDLWRLCPGFPRARADQALVIARLSP